MPVDPDALARAQPRRCTQLAALRRRGRRGARRAVGAGRRAWPPASTPAQLVLDPGLGFAKTAEHNWALLAGAGPRSSALGLPVLVGASRKSFLGRLLADADGTPRPADDREDATTALTACWPRWPAPGGCGCTRSRPSVDAALAIAAIRARARPMSRPDRAARAAGARPPRRVRASSAATARTSSSTSVLELDLAAAAVRRPRRHRALRRAGRAAGRGRRRRAGRTCSRPWPPGSPTSASPTRGSQAADGHRAQAAGADPARVRRRGRDDRCRRADAAR